MSPAALDGVVSLAAGAVLGLVLLGETGLSLLDGGILLVAWCVMSVRALVSAHSTGQSLVQAALRSFVSLVRLVLDL